MLECAFEAYLLLSYRTVGPSRFAWKIPDAFSGSSASVGSFNFRQVRKFSTCQPVFVANVPPFDPAPFEAANLDYDEIGDVDPVDS